jgi:putative acetyltransferase
MTAIRDARAADDAEISALISTSFGGQDEARLFLALRADGHDAFSLVATSDEVIVGHVLLSPMRAPFRALGLAPLSVAMPFRRIGIGAALIREAIRRAEASGWRSIFVLGDPAYYGRFGFSADVASHFTSRYAGPHFMALALGGGLPVSSGGVDYAPAFDRL